MADHSNIMAKESFWGSIVTYIGVSIGFLTTFLVLVAYLSPEEVGLTRVLVELSTLLSGLALMGMTTSISRYFPYFRTEPTSTHAVPHRGFFFWVISIAAIGLPITLGLYALLADWVNPFFGKGSTLLKDYYLWILPLTTIISLWTLAELFSIQLMHLAVPRVIKELVLRLLLLVCYLIYAFGYVDFSDFVCLFVGAYMLCMILAYLYLGRITPLSLKRDLDFPDTTLRRSFYRYTRLAILSVVGTTLAGRMDLFVLAFHPDAGLRSAAVFTIGFFMVSVIEIPTRAIIGLATARIADLMKDEAYPTVGQILERVSRFQVLTSMIIFLMMYASIDSLLSIMPNGDAYKDSGEVFVILGFAKLIEVCFTACHPIVNASSFYRMSLYYTIWTVVAAFVANYYFIPLWDAQGAALATLLTTTLGYGFLQVVVYRHLALSPLSWRIIRCIILGVTLYIGIKYLPELEHKYLNILVRSGLVGILALIGTWSLRLAPEAEDFIRSLISKKA